MSVALQLLTGLEVAGAVLFLDDGMLEIDAPDGVLTDNVLSSLRQYKPEVIDILQGRGEGPSRATPTPPRPLWWSPDLTDADNAKVDGFMQYGPTGPASHQFCYKCHNYGWTWTKTSNGPCAHCKTCGGFIGYGHKASSAEVTP